ncbi:histidine kinase [Lentzea tibetensis]|uniref:histidine kinase n=1 Tax=Lentzea tibetensis TaxID=2591470 RepID=A0A563EMG4_9PSEU|nr:histidine kinase [Lentzea tibetensis]TWP48253.1 histidine kinase [Lentzea tibetensis]
MDRWLDRFKGQQWPLAVVLGIALVGQLLLYNASSAREGFVWLLMVPTCGAAVLALKHRTTALVLAVGSIFVTSVAAGALNIFTMSLLSPITIAETMACMVIVAVTVRHGSVKESAVVVVALIAVSTHAAFVREGNFMRSNSDIAGAVLLGVLSIGAGLYFRARDAERERLITTAVSGAQREERISLARELHDVVAHHVTGMLVQAQAALEVSDEDPRAAHRLLPGIVRSGTDALGAMRRLVGTLRQGETDVATTDLGADVLALVERTRELGLDVRARIDLPADLAPELGRSVLRLVQESLTNVHKHAVSPTMIEVELSRTPKALRVVVADDGRGGPVQAGGYGLVGMRERVDLLGGLFSAGPREKGWQVLAELPLEGDK